MNRKITDVLSDKERESNDNINSKDEKRDAFNKAHEISVEDILDDEDEINEVIKDDPSLP